MAVRVSHWSVSGYSISSKDAVIEKMNADSSESNEDKSLISNLLLLYRIRAASKTQPNEFPLEDQIALGQKVEKLRKLNPEIPAIISGEEKWYWQKFIYYKSEAEVIVTSERNGILSKCTEEFRETYHSTVKLYHFKHKIFLPFIESLREVDVTNVESKNTENSNVNIIPKRVIDQKSENKQKKKNDICNCQKICKHILHKARSRFTKDKCDLRKHILKRKFHGHFTAKLCMRDHIPTICDEEFRQLFDQTARVNKILWVVLFRFTKRFPRAVIRSKCTSKVENISRNSLTIKKKKKKKLSLWERKLKTKFKDQFNFK